MDKAQQMVCDRLWTLFDFLATAAELEANQEAGIKAKDLEALVKASSHAGMNYRLHASATVVETKTTPHPAAAWRNAD